MATVETGGDPPSKMGRREFLRRGGIMLGVGAAAVGGVSMVSGLVELFTQPKFNPNWEQEAAQYPEVYSRDEVSESYRYVRLYEQESRVLAVEGRIDKIPDLADGAKLADSYRIINEENKRLSLLSQLTQEGQRKIREMADRSLVKVWGGLIVMEVGVVVAVLTSLPSNTSNEEDVNNQSDPLTTSS